MTDQLISKNDIKAIMGKTMSFKKFKEEVLTDYRLACESRELSLMCRREVLTGKAKFGIVGDGKELPQIVLSKFFKEGDFRSGYYRDQTLMLALGNVTHEQLFAQLYANPDLDKEPHSGGRQMNAHFATKSIDRQGNWNDLTKIKNTSADVSCTAGQMPRAVGLALASKQFRQNKALHPYKNLSNKGNEVTFVTIGDASTSEGVFWEAVNAAGVQQIPMAISVWDDGYGISVPRKYQTTKDSISEVLRGFEIDDKRKNGVQSGILIYKVPGWDYPEMMRVYREGLKKVRELHIPALFHITELTQPQGHSTSGSHERYKDKERLQWEKENDCLLRMHNWVIESSIATTQELATIRTQAKQRIKEARNTAWSEFNNPIKQSIKELIGIYQQAVNRVSTPNILTNAIQSIQAEMNPVWHHISLSLRQVLFQLRNEPKENTQVLIDWYQQFQTTKQQQYTSHLYSESSQSPLNIPANLPVYSTDAPIKNGSEILNACFDAALTRDPKILAFGEDVGKIGDVNQGMAGLQAKHGELRVFDTGIREWTIMGQGIGLAMRGLRPIAEIQYLDYLVYGLEPLTDDLASLHYRTYGGQKAPLIVRTRGHRLEGVWHAGSPLGMIINALRGLHVLVPRNMTQAAGFYNTLLQGDDPALVIECLNAYRLKERLPDNIGTFTIPLGTPEILRSGSDISIVTYGACCRIAEQAAITLAQVGIDCEIIDVQTLLPFDIHHHILHSLKKTNRVLFVDEDVPGGATAYMMQQVLEKQNAYHYLDSPPATLTATQNRPAYGSDGNYYCKPGVEDVIEKVYAIMHEFDPTAFPKIF